MYSETLFEVLYLTNQQNLISDYTHQAQQVKVSGRLPSLFGKLMSKKYNLFVGTNIDLMEINSLFRQQHPDLSLSSHQIYLYCY